MADISQINVNNTTYDLKDSKAKPIFIRLSTNKKLAEATITSDWSIFQFEDINGVAIAHSNAYACLLRGSPLQMRLYFLASDSSGTYDSDACYLLNWYYDSTNNRYSIINNYQEPLLDDNGCPAGYWSLSLYFNAQETCILEAMDQASTKYPNSDLIDLSQIEYDNTSSGLTATNVQDAIDEVDEKTDNISVHVTNNEQTNGTLIGTIEFTNQNGVTYSDNIRIPLNVPLIGRFDRIIYDQPQSPYLQYDLPRGVFAGHITGSSKDLYFFVPTPYDYSGEVFSSDTFLSATGAIRGISGYVDASSFTISDYKYNYNGQQTDTKRFTIDCQRGGILFMLHNENGFKTTASTPATYSNNTPVSVYFANFKLNVPYN